MDGFGAAGVLRVAELADPLPGPGQLLIRVAAAGVNRPDIVQREGNYPPPPGESERLGLECAGTVAALGEGVDRFEVGGRVCALVGGGAYAELAVAHAGHCLPIPDGLSLEQAAALPESYLTAWLNLFGNAGLADGEYVLLHGGGGGVGTAAIQLVAEMCPDSRIFTTASAAKADRLRALGAHEAIDYRASDFAAVIRRLTDRRGVDVILDPVGAAYLERNLAALAVDGRLVIIGIMGGSDAAIGLGRLMVKRQRIIGSVLRSRAVAEKAAIIAAFTEQVMPRVAAGRIAPLIDSRFPLEEAAHAHRRMESSEHFGKIVLTVES